MSVWLTIPSARPLLEAHPVLEKWRSRGYNLAIWRDPGQASGIPGLAIEAPYPGYAQAVNGLVARVMDLDPDAEWFVAGGDDTEPDPAHTAEEIAAQCNSYFTLQQMRADSSPNTFGVMQPTGDRFDGGSIDRICGSPWLGREFCRRINQGRGPLWPEYKHMFVDEELQHAAIKYGVLWQRPDLIHLHHHFARASAHLNSRAVAVSEGGVTLYGGDKKPRPVFLDEANSGSHWAKYKGLFLERKRAGFPGSEPL